MFYSKSKNGFYSVDIHGDNIPEDAVEISEEEHISLLNAQSNGDIIVSNDDGYPVIMQRPAPTDEEIKRQNEGKVSSLIAEASSIISPMADAKAGGYIDESDLPLLDKWQRYRYALTKVDTSNPEWPVKPE